MSSDTASFTDPQFLATYGLSRLNALEYFLHPLNPFRSKNQTCNEILAMQGISLPTLIHGIGQHQHASSSAAGGGIGGPLSLERAEEEYNSALSRLQGEQYELVAPPPLPKVKGSSNKSTQQHQQQQQLMDPSQSPLFTIRHVLRTKTKVAILGVYYILDGIIYKSPSARALMKHNIARTCQGLIDVCDSLSACVNYSPTTGYYWDFNAKPSSTKKSSKKRERNENHEDEIEIYKQLRKMKRESVVIDKKRRPEDRTEEEEEATRAKDRINAILIRMSKSSLVKGT